MQQCFGSVRNFCALLGVIGYLLFIALLWEIDPIERWIKERYFSIVKICILLWKGRNAANRFSVARDLQQQAYDIRNMRNVLRYRRMIESRMPRQGGYTQ